MNKEKKLHGVLALLRNAIRAQALNSQVVADATNALREIDNAYIYNLSLFPRLPNSTSSWNRVVGDAPSSLAEALLWKMGKWKIYRQFCEYYAASSPKSKGTDVVFYAFARHLKDKSNPIYDQHALRALWCIDAELSDEEKQICKSLLLGKTREKARNVQWKSILGGADADNGYQLYCKSLRRLCSGGGLPTPDKLDKLLMPLGQAIKQLISPNECLEIVMPPGDGSRGGVVSTRRSARSVMPRRRPRS